jgi:hypothetical protein
MANPLSIVIENAREEFLSSDFTRAEQLASTQAQNILRDTTRLPDAGNALDDGAFNGDKQSNAFLMAPTLTPAAGFTMDLGVGQLMTQDGSADTLDGDGTNYFPIRWIADVLTFAAPDPVNPRIDLVAVDTVITTVNTDLESRNILLDPVLRTVAPASVPKTQHPRSAVSVVTGTPAAIPLPPAIPAGSVALMLVHVPAAAPSSATFSTARVATRLTSYPMSTAHGIFAGCNFLWSDVDDTVVDSDLSLAVTEVNKVMISGELLSFHGGFEASPPEPPLIVQASGADDPFAVAAPATNDKPYYLYACGGRFAPFLVGRRGFLFGGADALNPVVIVESLTPPTVEGYASAALTTALGTFPTPATLFVGCGWVTKGTTFRKAITQDREWFWANSSFIEGTVAPVIGTTDLTLASRPFAGICKSAMIRARLLVGAAGVVPTRLMAFRKRTAVPVSESLAEIFVTVLSTHFAGLFQTNFVTTPELVYTTTTVADVFVELHAQAYKVQLPRLRSR